MIWLQSPPWARWILSLLIAAAALWIELRPEQTIAHPFALEDISAGTVVDHTNTEVRQMPVGAMGLVELGQTALDSIEAGNPILASDLGDSHQVVPSGWWAIEISLPSGAQSGDPARLVVLDSEVVVDGVVTTPASDDPLGSGVGMVAIEPEQAAEVARAAAEGRAAVMIASR